MIRARTHRNIAVRHDRKTKRSIGLAKKRVRLSKSFFKPLPDELLDAFEGKRYQRPPVIRKSCSFAVSS